MKRSLDHPYVIAMRWAALPDEFLSEADLERLGEHTNASKTNKIHARLGARCAHRDSHGHPVAVEFNKKGGCMNLMRTRLND